MDNNFMNGNAFKIFPKLRSECFIVEFVLDRSISFLVRSGKVINGNLAQIIRFCWKHADLIEDTGSVTVQHR